MVAPGWLLGLLLVPLVRWLHRGGRAGREVPVAHLDLWEPLDHGRDLARRQAPPDPAWRRRAAFVALVCLALAGPQGGAPPPPLTLWLDDSPSVLLREDGGTRLDLLLAQARAAMAGRGGSVQVRALSDPWRERAGGQGLDAALGSRLAATVGRGEARPPPAELLGQDPPGEHWLLTDGVHAEPMAWPGGRRPDRVLRAGQRSRNVGLTRLSARRAPGLPGQLSVLVGVHNGGSEPEARELHLHGPGGDGLRRPVAVEPGRTRWLTLTLPQADSLQARLLPADDLPLDDELSLDLRALSPRALAIDPRCPRRLVDAMAAHPAFVPATAGRAPELGLACGADATPAPTAPLLTLAEGPPRRSAGPWLAAPALGAPPEGLDADRALPLRGRLDARPGDTVLLAAAGEPVVVRRPGEPRRIEVALDLASMAGEPAAPLWLNRLFEALLERPLLDAVAGVGRSETAIQVRPAADPAPDSAAAAAPAPANGRPPASEVIRSLLALLAAVLLAVEGVEGLRRRRLGRRPAARPGAAA